MNAPPIIASRACRLLFMCGLLLAVFPIVVSDDSVIGMFDRICPGTSASEFSMLELLLMPVFMVLCYLQGFGFMLGSGICFWCLGWFLLKPGKPWLPSVVLVPLLCDAFMFTQALPFLAVPRGAGIRPMGWVALAFLLGLGITVFAWFYVSWQLRKQPNRAAVMVGYLLSLLPVPLAMISLFLMAAIKGFELEQ
jgi:hypothetical protein